MKNIFKIITAVLFALPSISFAAQITVPSATGRGMTLVSFPSGAYQATSTLTVNSTGKVGIGTTTPFAKLSVDTTGLTSGPSFSIGSSTRQDFLVDNTGNVMVATTTNTFNGPLGTNLAKLTVQGGGQFGSIATFASTVTNAGPGWAGVGIDTSSQISSVGSTYALMISTQANANSFSVSNAGAARSNIMSVLPGSTINGTAFLVQSSNMSANQDFVVFDNSSMVSNVGVGRLLRAATQADNFNFLINNGGNVGIGSSTPWGKFVASSTGTTPTLNIQQNSTGPAAIFQGGSVGIGTVAPANPFVLRGAGATPVLSLESSSFGHSFSNSIYSRPNQFAAIAPGGSSQGGMNLVGISSGGIPGAVLYGVTNDTTATAAPTTFISAKRSGSATAALTATEKAFSFLNGAATFGNNGTELLTILGGGNLGVGTTSPFANLSVATPNGATGSQTVLFAIASSTASATTTLFSVKNTGEITTNGGTPTISTCGTVPNGSVVGNDTAGKVTVGGGVVTACTVTFAAAKKGTLHVFIQVEGVTGVANSVSAQSSTGFTANFASALGGGAFDYWIVSDQ